MNFKGETPVRWSTLSILGTIIITVVFGMWTLQGSMVKWENRMTSIEKDVQYLIKIIEKREG